MRQTLVSLLLFAIVSYGGTAWAADQMTPGLWVMAIKSGMLKSMPTLTPQQLKKMQEMGGIKVPKMSDGTPYSMDVIGNNADMKGQGRMESTFSSVEAFTSTCQFKGIAHGQPIEQSSETTGKWVGDDCGSVKPIDIAGQKY